MSTEKVTETVPYSPDPTLTPQQHRVVTKLACGFTATQAAQAEKIHRNTIANWRRTVPAFAREVEFATRERCRYWHNEAVKLAPDALHNLRMFVVAPGFEPSIVLRASLAILKIATQPDAMGFEAHAFAKAEQEAESGRQLASAAQPSVVPSPSEAPSPTPPEAVQNENIEKVAQSCTTGTVRKAPIPGRNSLCPCQSGRKFKRCCSQMPNPLLARAAAANQ